MECPQCSSQNIRKLRKKTWLGYQQFICRSCHRQYNERTGTPLNFIEYPTEVVMITVHYYYRFKVSLDDAVELMAMRGISLSHQTVHNWVQTFGVELGLKCRSHRKGKAGKKWHVDATYVRIHGHWCYLYRAIDKEGNLVDVYLSDERNQAAGPVSRFLRPAATCSINSQVRLIPLLFLQQINRLREQAQDMEPEAKQQTFDADFIIMTTTLSSLLRKLIDLFEKKQVNEKRILLLPES